MLPENPVYATIYLNVLNGTSLNPTVNRICLMVLLLVIAGAVHAQTLYACIDDDTQAQPECCCGVAAATPCSSAATCAAGRADGPCCETSYELTTEDTPAKMARSPVWQPDPSPLLIPGIPNPVAGKPAQRHTSRAFSRPLHVASVALYLATRRIRT